MAEDTDILEPPVAEDQEQPQTPPEQGPGPKVPTLKDPDKQKLAQIITKMQSAGESDDNIRGVVKRFQEVNAIQQSSPVDQGTAQTTNKLNQAIQFTGTFQPDLEGEKKGLYLNDPDYQKQRADFTNRIYTDDKGNLNYPEQDKKGNWSNYYTKQPLPNFDPHTMRGRILQVPKEYQAATNGKQFITPVYNQKTNSYDFPDVETPSVPHMNELSPVTVYGSKGQPKAASYSPVVNAMVGESKKQGGQLDQVLANHPDLAPAIDQTLKKYGDQYTESLNNGSPAMTNAIQKSIEDKYDLNTPLPANVDQKVLNSHLNVLNAFDENRANFQDKQNELQKQADLMTDRAKRTGVPITQNDVDRLNQKQQQNIDNWNNYQKSVNFSKNYVNQPEVKEFLNKFQQKQQGLKVLDEVRQRSFPDDTNAAIKQDEYNRKGIEGNLSVWDYLKTAGGRAASGISNLSETYQKMQGLPGPIAEAQNAQTQGWIKNNLPQLSPEAIEEMNKGKHGVSALLSDLSGTVGSFAPYIIPGMAEEGLGAKAATFATALATSLPEVKQQALDAGLTGKAYSTYLTAKPLVDAAFMTLLPSGKMAKGFEGDVAKAIENGEYNNPKQFLMDMAGKAFKDPHDVAHLQAMLSGTNLGDALTNKFVNSLQAGEDANRGIKRNGDPLSTDISNVFNPKQTATMALAAKVMESVPTILHGSQDYKTLRDVGKTYENARNNMVELAANDLQGATAKVNEILKTDPSNIYAQHIKATLEDFADAKSKMPDGLSPEQQTALFDLQRKISANNRQAQTAEASYVPHIEKNTEALKKQIPEIIDSHDAALKYLQPAHDELVNNIQSSKTESNETAETDQNRPQAEGQQGQIEEPEGAESQPSATGAAPSISEPVSEEGKAAIKEANKRKKEVQDAGFDFLAQEDDGGFYNKNRQYSPDEVPIGMAGLKHEEHGKGLGTLGYILKGEEYLKQGRHLISEPENRADQATRVWKKLVKLGLATETTPGNYKYGGERNSSKALSDAPSYLLSRHADTIKDEEGKVSGPNQHPLSTEGRKDANDLANEVKDHADKTGVPVTKIVHSGLERAGETAEKVAEKTGAKTVSDPKLNTWDIKDFDDVPDEEFKRVQKWFGEHPNEKVYNGPIEKFHDYSVGESLNEYAHRTIDAHAKYENEPESTLLIDHSNNMMVMDAYRKNGNQWNEQAIHDYLNAEKPEPATLTNKISPNAEAIRSNTGQLPESGEAISGSKNAGSNDVQQGKGEPSGLAGTEQQISSGESSGTVPKEESEDTSEKAKVEDDLPFIEEEGDNEFTSLKNAVTKQKVEDAGLEPAMKEAARDFGTVWTKAQKELAKGYDIEKLLKSLDKKPRAVTDLENAMILFHQNVKESQLDAANKDLDQARKDNNRQEWNDAYDRRAKLLDDLQDIYNVDKKIGRETARGLNARKMMADRRFSLVNMQLEKRASAGGEPLTDEQTAEVKKQYEDIKKTKEALDARVSELQKENEKLTAEASVREMEREVRDEKVKQKTEKVRKDLSDNFTQLKKIAKEQRQKLSANPLPVEAIPVIGKIAKNLIRLGVTKIEGIANHIFDQIKDDYEGLSPEHIMEAIDAAGSQEKLNAFTNRTRDKISDIQDKLSKQDFSKKPPSPPVKLDAKALKLQAAYERAKDAFEQGLKKDQLKSRSNFQKTQDAFLKYERFAKLSNPITLGKLTAAAMTRLATTPVEELAGLGYSKLLPGIAKSAPGEAGFHVKALAKGYKATFMRGLEDAAKVAKGGKTDIEAVYGSKGHLPPESIDFFGQLHSAIKAPVKRFAFERSFEKRVANNIKNGVTITPMVEARIAIESYKDAQRSIFMQDNPVSRGWTSAMTAMEKSGDAGKLVSTIGQWLIPFVKVPTNIVGETISHVAGPEIALGKIIATSLGKGLKNLSQDEAESVMRNLKKGTIGHVALMAGYLNPQVFGGYYQNKEKRAPGDVKAGDMKILGHTIPAWALEAPLFQAMQLGATVRRVKDTMIKGQEKGIGEGLWGGALGLMAHEPLIDEPSRLGGMLASDKERQYFLGELAKSTLVPAAADYAAKVSDPADKRPISEKLIEPENKRQPTTVKEHIESAIPGLREDVGEKKPTGSHRQRQHK